MTSTRRELSALIDTINADLTEYLAKTTHEVCNQTRRDSLTRSYSSWGWHSIPHQDQFVVVYNDPSRNNQLTAKRIANVIDAQNQLRKIQSEFKHEESDDLPKKLTGIQTILDRALENNNNYSIEHQKVHRSYQGNRLAKMGVFASWRHKTWYQSRATIALETALDHLAQFKKASDPSPTKKCS